MKLTKRTAQVMAVLLVPSVLAACGSGGGESSSAADVDPRMPESVQESGELVAGTSVGLPPYQYYDEDGTTVIGYEPDLMAGVAEHLGVEITWQNDAFASLFSGLKTDRFDILMNGITVTAERQQDNDYIAYARDAYGVLVEKGNPGGYTEDTDFCGGAISALRGSTADTWVQDLSARCVAAGMEPVETLAFDSGTQALLAVETGRAAGTTAQTAQLLYYAKESPDKYELLDSIEYSAGYVGLVVAKGNDDEVEAIMEGLQASMDDGSYAEVMKEWNLESLMIDEPLLNPAT